MQYLGTYVEGTFFVLCVATWASTITIQYYNIIDQVYLIGCNMKLVLLGLVFE